MSIFNRDAAIASMERAPRTPPEPSIPCGGRILLLTARKNGAERRLVSASDIGLAAASTNADTPIRNSTRTAARRLRHRSTAAHLPVNTRTPWRRDIETIVDQILRLSSRSGARGRTSSEGRVPSPFHDLNPVDSGCCASNGFSVGVGSVVSSGNRIA